MAERKTSKYVEPIFEKEEANVEEAKPIIEKAEKNNTVKGGGVIV